MYDTIMFDFFGVIYGSLYDVWLHHHGHHRSGKFATLSNQVDAGEITMQEFFDELSAMTGVPSGEIKAEYKSLSSVNQPLVDLIKNLRGKYKIVLLSNASGPYLRQILRQNDMEPLFDEIVVSGEVRMIKPDREIFDLALGKAGSSVKSTVFVDDHAFNIAAAESYGITSVQYHDFDQLKYNFHKLGII